MSTPTPLDDILSVGVLSSDGLLIELKRHTQTGYVWSTMVTSAFFVSVFIIRDVHGGAEIRPPTTTLRLFSGDSLELDLSKPLK